MMHLGYIIQVLERRNYKEEKLRYKGPNVLMPFEERPRTCILVDNCGYAHFFNSDDVRFSVGSWVTFEGEGTEAKDVFHSDDYSKSDYPKETYQKDKSGITIPGSGKLIPMQLCSSGCVIDKNGKLHYMHQKGGKDILALSHIQKGVPLKTEPIPYDTIESYESKVKEFLNQVSYVSTHLREIADSFSVDYIMNIREKNGDSDCVKIYRNSQIAHNDSYIDKIFQCGRKEIEYFYIYGCEPDFKYTKEFIEEEKRKLKDIFVQGYDKHKHLSMLLYDYHTQQYLQIEKVKKENEELLRQWNVNLVIDKINVYSSLKTCIEAIEYYNKILDRKSD